MKAKKTKTKKKKTKRKATTIKKDNSKKEQQFMIITVRLPTWLIKQVDKLLETKSIFKPYAVKNRSDFVGWLIATYLYDKLPK